MKFLILIGSFIFATCATINNNQQTYTSDQLIFKSPLTTFSGSEGFRMMSSTNCNSTGMSELIKTLQNIKSDTLTIACYSGYLGTDADNKKNALKIACYIKSCIDTTFANRFVIEPIGFGNEAIYTMEKDTTLSGVDFKKGDTITKATYQKLKRQDIMYLESKVGRLEVYANQKL